MKANYMSALHNFEQNTKLSGNVEPEAVQRLREVLERQIKPRRSIADVWANPAVRRSAKVGLGVALVIGFGLAPARIMLQPSSVEAVVNRRIVTLRAPIEGELGRAMADGSLVLSISNPRADRSRLDELESQLARRNGQRAALVSRIEEQQAALARLEEQSEFFRIGRVKQLTARNADLQARVQIAAARREEAHAAFARSSALARTGAVSSAEFGRLTRERAIADQTEISMQQQLAAAAVELEAARKGVFIGDSYNDRPSSVQAADEARRRLAEWRADFALADSEISFLAREADAERSRFAARSSAELKAPATGRVWETLAAPGEQVRAGQDILRVLDCSRALVTAAVTERVYNKLAIGAPARFIPADGGPDLSGVVTDLTGPAGISGNLAISPGALDRKEPYRANVELQDAGAGCGVGRTGRVVFDTAAVAQ